MSLLKLFRAVDDFRQVFQPRWQRFALIRSGERKVRQPQLAPSEIMTVLIRCQQSHYRGVPQQAPCPPPERG